MPDGLKKAIAVVMICWVLFYIGVCISGCGQEYAEAHYTAGAIESTEPVTHNIIGVNALLELPIGEGLYYDYTTGIVYWWNGICNRYNDTSTTPTPYYSPNGLLYRYIPETNMLEEIKNEVVCTCIEGDLNNDRKNLRKN